MANIKDVAKHAGVSVTTVSRCFNNRGYISQSTRDKIEMACKELNYQPNEIARSLFKKKSNIIGVIIPRLDSYFFAELLQYIEDLLYKKGYKMLLCSTNGDEYKEKSYLDMFKAQKVDGVIIASYLTEDHYDYTNIGMPAVAFDRHLHGDIKCIGSDHYQAGVLATQKLIDLGCRKLAHFRGQSIVSSPTHNKTKAFMDLAIAQNIEHCVIEKQVSRDSEEEFDRCMTELNNIMPDYDGIFLNDFDAVIFLQYANRNGIRVPDDVQVIGIDDIKLSHMVTPQITTVKQSYDLISQTMVESLIKLIDGETISSKNLDKLPVELIERNTTKSP